MINVLSLHKNNRVFLYSQDKSSIAAAEAVNSIVLEFASQKEKTFQLIPGADVKSVLGEGDDLIQTHAESGMSYTPYHGKARGGGGTIPIIAYTGRLRLKGAPLSGFGYIAVIEVSSSETRGQSVGSGEKLRRKVLSTGGLFHPCHYRSNDRCCM